MPTRCTRLRGWMLLAGLFVPCCAHRVVSKTYLHNGDANGTTTILQAVLDRVPTPK